MFYDKSRFRHYTPCHFVSTVVANGSSTKMLGSGDVGLLTNLLHINGLLYDLVSEPVLTSAGMFGTWSSLSCVVKHIVGKVSLEATLYDDDLYKVTTTYL